MLGSIYGLIALGYTMVYGILRIINFAHGDLLMVGALTALSAILGLQKFAPGLPEWLTLVIATPERYESRICCKRGGIGVDRNSSTGRGGSCSTA